MIAAFVERRGQDPEGQETIQLPVSRAIVYSLHAGRWRALTWWEPELGVVWLIGAGYHRSGERSDAYAVLKRRDEADELFPTEQDYLDLEPDPADYVQAVARDAPALVSRARQTPGEEVHGDLAGALDISVMSAVVEDAGQRLEEIWVGFSMPPKGPVPPHPAWLLTALAVLFPRQTLPTFTTEATFPELKATSMGRSSCVGGDTLTVTPDDTAAYLVDDINVEWEIELHPEVSDWLWSLPDKEFGRAARYIDLLEAEGLTLKEPYTRQLRGALRELRFELRDVTPRITYFNIAGRRLVLLTVFRK